MKNKYRVAILGGILAGLVTSPAFMTPAAAKGAALRGLAGAAASVIGSDAEPKEEKPVMTNEIRRLLFSSLRGNCIACHKIEGGESPGNIGPALENMDNRFPNKADLRAQIWDASKRNPSTVMPPFGRHEILTEKEIDLIVDYLYAL